MKMIKMVSGCIVCQMAQCAKQMRKKEVRLILTYVLSDMKPAQETATNIRRCTNGKRNYCSGCTGKLYKM